MQRMLLFIHRTGVGMLLILICSSLFTACNTTNPARTSEDHLAKALYVEEVAQAANELIALTPDHLRDSLVYPFYSDNRTVGRDDEFTPSFCAVLAWCAKGWGLEIGKLSHKQLVALHKILNLALSPGGYQSLRAVINHQRLIGEMEEVGESSTITKAVEEHPDTFAASIFEFQGDIPDSLFYPTLAGGGRPMETDTSVNWIWGARSKMERRWGQFQRYTLAIFGNPGEEDWGIRFEGHHITVNISFMKDKETGQYHVHATPLFFGTFPMIVSDPPFAKEDISAEWNWEKGQLMMFSVAHHLRKFWLEVPEDLRVKALISPHYFPQAAPLTLSTPISTMISSMDPQVDTARIRSYPHIDISTNELSSDALWHLKQAYMYFVGAMNTNVSKAYEGRIDAALAPGQALTLSWAGTSLENVGSSHFSYIHIGSLLLEFLQSNQFVVQHDPEVTGNHLHSMLRDMQYDWIDPMHDHHVEDHLVH